METCVLSTNISGRKTPKLSVGLSRVISNKRNAAMESETNMNGSSEDQAVPVSEEILQEETDNKNEQSSDEHNISESPNRGKKRKLDENDDTTNENTTEESNEVPKDTENDNTSNVQNEDSVPESTEGDKEPDPTLQESENTENKTEPVSKPKAKPRSAPKPKRRSTFFTRKKSARKAPRSSMLADEPADEMDINDDAEKVQVKEEVDTGDEIKDNSELRTDDATEVPMSLMDVDKNEDTLSQNDVNSSAASSPAVARLSQKSVRSNRNNSPAAEFAKKSKVVPDLTNPVYLKPFEYGWRRELVYRSSYDSSGKRNGDVYYVAPTGKKLRSMREVVQNIRGKELSEDNFTFCKETLGLNDPEKEIVRDAKVKGTPGPATPTAITKKAEKPKKGLFSPKVASPKGAASPKIVPSPSQSPNSATITPKLGKSPRLSSGFKVKSTGARLSQGTPRSVKASRKNKRPAEEPIEDLQMGMLPPERSLTKKISSPSRQTKPMGIQPIGQKQNEPCSIRCKGVNAVVPTMQCRLCLCLYHPECIGLDPHNLLHHQFVCQNCQPGIQDEKTTTESTAAADVSLPRLTPISAIKSHPPVLALPPKLQRIPRLTAMPKLISQTNDSKSDTIDNSNAKPTKLMTVPKYVRMAECRPSQTESNKSLVGSVTTWLPPSSTIQMAQSHSASNKEPFDTSVSSISQIMLGERKYIVVPRSNVLSVHPNDQSCAAPIPEKPPTPSLPESSSGISAHIPDAPSTASMGPTELDDSVYKKTNETVESIPEASVDPDLSVTATKLNLKPKVSEDKDKTPPNGHQKIIEKQAAEVGAAIVKTTTNTKSKRIAQKSNTVSTVKATESQESRFMQYFIMHVSVGYTALLQVFQYLKVQELLRAGRVCRLWRDIAGHTSLWRTVRMKNSQVCDWDGLAESLQRHGTRTLDLRKMLIPGNGDEMWLKFSKAIGKAEHLTRIELCRCPATVVEELANSNPKLQIINAVTIKCDSINLEGFGNFQNLKELRLKSQNGMELSSDLSAFKSLTNLKHLSLTSIKKLGKKDVGVIADLVDLQSLELGECNELPDNFGTDVLLKLEKLTSLRLEKGQGSCCTFNILEAVSKLPLVEQLELVNFDVKVGFDKAMALCTNIKRLLIIPTYISQSATTNHMVLGGVLQLTASLSHFVWGVTLELLRVTELFVDQCDQTPKGSPQSPTKKEKKTSGSGDSIPVLKPVPFLEKKDNSSEDTTAKDNPQVEILPLPALQKLLSEKLPTTRVKILKIPFHATWRQSITDSVN